MKTETSNAEQSPGSLKRVVRPTGIANIINKFFGGASPEPDDRRNNNPDFLAGYAVGMTCDKQSELDPITEEWRDRGEPNGTDRLFKEWKRGYWAGVFHRIEGRSWSNDPSSATASTARPERKAGRRFAGARG